jgi:pimeloyl-ACP methyl ester carboxylesterase
VLWLLAATLVADSTRNIQVALPRAETLHVEVRGVGEPAVLIPGLFGSAYAFRNLAPMLNARGYRTIIIEPLGIGASAKPAQADYSLDAQAERVAAVLDTLGVRHALVLAHSVGGSEAFRLAYRRPDLVAALVSIEGGPAETAATPSLKRAMRFAPWIKVLGGVRLIRWKIRKVLVASSGDPRWVSDEIVEGYTAAAARDLDGTLKALLAVAASREHDQLAPHLAEIHCPVRLLIGGVPHDGDVGQNEIALLQRTLPRFAIDSVPGAGHFLYEEQPQAVIDAVQRAAVAAADPPAAADP